MEIWRGCSQRRPQPRHAGQQKREGLNALPLSGGLQCATIRNWRSEFLFAKPDVIFSKIRFSATLF